MLEFRLQKINRAANHAALKLNQASVEGDPAVHRGKQAEGAFAPDVRCLDSRAVLQHGEQREHGALRKIGVLEEATRFADDVTKFELDRLKVRLYPLAAGSLQGTEQLIALRIISLSYGDTVEMLQT